ncbi:hypothetical protein B0H17DRAFT_1209671 [Mycena rosella]|uniref:Sulfotransferase n=1 Tax=Mycena rosella TaxID=1033263 RepID=A0AAD7G5W4_MYCRO|nr:hypothetical protein B0H17DRAFT_1209671 [Mycena rosella]
MAPTIWIDCRGAKRTVEMQVPVLGFPRTGTTSIQEVLELPGYHDVHHIRSMYENPPEADMWAEAIKARFFGCGTPVAPAQNLVVPALFGPVVTEEGAKARCIEHYESLRWLVPKERLLEYEVKDGWGPLPVCAFLGKDVPAGSSPG